MSFLIVWRLFPLLGLVHVSVLAELNYYDPSRGVAPFIFTDASPEYRLGENAGADSWDIPPPQYGFGDNTVADSLGEATDGANFLQLNIAIAPQANQAQSPEPSWLLNESPDCSSTNNPNPNKRRARRESGRYCPVPTDGSYNQIAPGREAGSQPASLVFPPVILRQDRKPKPNSALKPKPILKGDPVHANEWVCEHRTVNYPVCADFKHATEKPLGSNLYELLMAKLCEDHFSGHFPPSIHCFRSESGIIPFTTPNFSSPSADRILQLVFRLTYFADDPAHCEAPDILWCCGRVEKVSFSRNPLVSHLPFLNHSFHGGEATKQLIAHR